MSSSDYQQALEFANALITRMQREIESVHAGRQNELGVMKKAIDASGAVRLCLVPDSTPKIMIGPDVYFVDRALTFVPDYPMTRTLKSQPEDGNYGEEHSTRWGQHKHDWRTGGTLVTSLPDGDPAPTSDIAAVLTDIPPTGQPIPHDHDHRVSIPSTEADGSWREYDDSGLDNYNVHTHDIMLPWRLEPLKDKDRVLISWANGSIPVITAVVQRGSNPERKKTYDGTVVP